MLPKNLNISEAAGAHLSLNDLSARLLAPSDRLLSATAVDRAIGQIKGRSWLVHVYEIKSSVGHDMCNYIFGISLVASR